MTNNARIDITMADNTVMYTARSRDYSIPTGVKAKHWYMALPQQDTRKIDSKTTVKIRIANVFNRLKSIFAKSTEQIFAPALCEAEEGGLG